MKLTGDKDVTNHLLMYGGDDVFDAYQPLKDSSDGADEVIDK